MGNIVRSPVAEHLFMEHVKEAGVDEKYEASSAGTIGYHVGEPPDPRMVRIAASRGTSYSHQACQFTIPDLDRFDLIIVMDRENRGDVISLTRTPEQRAKIHLLREFDPKGGKDVPDPYYDGLDSFEEVYSMIDRSTKGLLSALENGKVG
jgi:protein-tyrosine phosphatase